MILLQTKTLGVLTTKIQSCVGSLSWESYQVHVINALEAKRLGYNSIYTEQVLENNIILILNLVCQNLQVTFFKIK